MAKTPTPEEAKRRVLVAARANLAVMLEAARTTRTPRQLRKLAESVAASLYARCLIRLDEDELRELVALLDRARLRRDRDLEAGAGVP